MIFDMGMFYGVVACVCAIIMYVLLNRTMNTKFKELIDRRFSRLLVFFIAFCAVDCIWGFLYSHNVLVNYWGLVVFSYGFHSLAALSAFMWSDYISSYIEIDFKNNKFLLVSRIIFLAIQFGILISNIWTHALFDVDRATVTYHSYQLRNIMFYLQFAYYIVILVYVVIHLMFSNNKTNDRNFKSAAIFSLVILLFGLGQMFLPDVCMYSLGFTLSAVTIYSFNITTQREDYMQQTYEKENAKLSTLAYGLAEDVRSICYIDLDTGEYELMSNKNDDRSYKGENFFSEEARSIFASEVYEDDVKLALHYISKDTILKELSDKNVFSFGFRAIDLDETFRYYRAKVVKPENNKDGNKIILGIYDEDERVREQLRHRHIIEQATIDAHKASKAKTEFLFNMSHDIRTPMNAIMGFTDMAKRHIDNKESVEDCLNKISMSSDNLLSLINDVLDMSRIESGKVELQLDSNDIVKQIGITLDLVQELANQKQITLNREFINIANKFLVFDSLHLNQVLTNILSNAIKYTPNGGRVDFSLEQLPYDDERYAYFKVIVKDNGIGMSKEFVSHIYDEFAREKTATKSRVTGTGLGMSIVKHLVDMMGYQIDVKSKEGEGTVVTLSMKMLKANDVVTSDENKSISIEKNDNLVGKRILLVEDNELNREIARDILEEFGLVVEEAEDGSYAVEKVHNAETGYYDLILMDVQMPIMDGYAATKSIRLLTQRRNEYIPIVAMTANAFVSDRNDALEAGMDEHLSKPIKIDALLETLNKFIK